MLALVTAVLLVHCATHCAADHRLFVHLDHSLHQMLYSAPRDAFMESMLSVFKTINTSYAACLVTLKQQWRNLQIQGQFPRICGSIGYTEAEPVPLIWTINTYSGVLLNITYLELPFLNLGCPFARLTISSITDAVYCGRRSHWGVFADTNITVHLQQDIILLRNTGFVATYVAVDVTDMDNIGAEYHLVEDNDNDGRWINTSIPLLESRRGKNNAPKFIWHIIVHFDKFIKFSIESNNEYQICDGPGPLSPVLHNEEQSSAFHLYLVQRSPHLTLQYASAVHTSFNTERQAVLSSHPNRNTMYAYQVRGGKQALRISFLSIHSHEILTDFAHCFFGGLFLVGPETVLKVCETTWQEGLLYHLAGKEYPDALQLVIFVILYGSYTDGKVVVSVESNMETCYNRKPKDMSSVLDLYPGCNQLTYFSAYDQYLFQMFSLNRPGPVDLKVYILPVIYKLYNIQLNITVTDSNILGKDRITTYTDIAGTHAHVSYQNPDQFVLKEILMNQFTTWRLTIIQVIRKALCDYEHTHNGHLSLPGTQAVTLYPYKSRCRCGVDGHVQYTAHIISTDNNINVGVLFSKKCASDCHLGNVTFTEYNAQYDTLFVHRFTSLPTYWDNIHSNSSVQINIEVADICKSCPLWFAIAPAWHIAWGQQNLDSTSLNKKDTKSPRITYPTE